jgi:hypothetical protein
VCWFRACSTRGSERDGRGAVRRLDGQSTGLCFLCTPTSHPSPTSIAHLQVAHICGHLGHYYMKHTVDANRTNRHVCKMHQCSRNIAHSTNHGENRVLHTGASWNVMMHAQTYWAPYIARLRRYSLYVSACAMSCLHSEAVAASQISCKVTTAGASLASMPAGTCMFALCACMLNPLCGPHLMSRTFQSECFVFNVML